MESTSSPRVFFTRSRSGVPWFLWAVALSAVAWPATLLAAAGKLACAVFVDDRYAVVRVGSRLELAHRRGRGAWKRVARFEAPDVVIVSALRGQLTLAMGNAAWHIRFRSPRESRRAASAMCRALRGLGLTVRRDDSVAVLSARPTLDTRAAASEWTSLLLAVPAAALLWLAAGPLGFVAVVIAVAAVVQRVVAALSAPTLAR